MWRWYKSMLLQHPLLTKAVTSAVIMSTSDSLCQLYEIQGLSSSHMNEYRGITKRRENDIIMSSTTTCLLTEDKATPPTAILASSPALLRSSSASLFSWERTLHVGITGFTFSGPISHVWYNLLERFVRIEYRLVSLAIKLVLDALIFSPVAVAGYFTWRRVLETSQNNSSTRVLPPLDMWQQAVQASWSFWPAANVINFTLVPTPFRVLFNNSLSLLWNAYLTHLHHKRQ